MFREIKARASTKYWTIFPVHNPPTLNAHCRVSSKLEKRWMGAKGHSKHTAASAGARLFAHYSVTIRTGASLKCAKIIMWKCLSGWRPGSCPLIKRMFTINQRVECVYEDYAFPLRFSIAQANTVSFDDVHPSQKWESSSPRGRIFFTYRRSLQRTSGSLFWLWHWFHFPWGDPWNGGS